jgi:hypothetical protein
VEVYLLILTNFVNFEFYIFFFFILCSLIEGSPSSLRTSSQTTCPELQPAEAADAQEDNAILRL